jgi:hypothetical protein
MPSLAELYEHHARDCIYAAERMHHPRVAVAGIARLEEYDPGFLATSARSRCEAVAVVFIPGGECQGCITINGAPARNENSLFENGKSLLPGRILPSLEKAPMRLRSVMVLTGGKRPFRTRRHEQLRLGRGNRLNLVSRALYEMEECDATPTHSSNRSGGEMQTPIYFQNSPKGRLRVMAYPEITCSQERASAHNCLSGTFTLRIGNWAASNSALIDARRDWPRSRLSLGPGG